MGTICSRVCEQLFRKKQRRTFLMVGLDCAGKTTILFKLRLGEIVTTISPFRRVVETVEYKGILRFRAWDLGGADLVHPPKHDYYQNVQGLIYVVDSNDRDRLDEARNELHRILNEDELEDAVLLVFANKQDLPNAMDLQEVADKLGLHGLRDRQWFIQTCCATSGEGLFEGLDWLSDTLQKRK